MCLFEWQALKPADLAQVLAVPVTAWITYKVFRLGETSENKRQRANLAAQYATRCEELVKTVEADSVRYYTTQPTSSERTELAAKIRLDTKSLSRSLGQLAEICNEQSSYFSTEYAELLVATTGGDFGTKTPKKRGLQDPTIFEIHRTISDLSTKVHKKLKALLP